MKVDSVTDLNLIEFHVIFAGGFLRHLPDEPFHYFGATTFGECEFCVALRRRATDFKDSIL